MYRDGERKTGDAIDDVAGVTNEGIVNMIGTIIDACDYDSDGEEEASVAACV